MATTYRSSPALMMLGAERLLSESVTFRKQTGAASPTDAKKKILFGEKGLEDDLKLGQTLEGARPFAIVGVGGHGYAQIGQGAQITLGALGGVYIVFSDKPSNPADHKTSYLDFMEWMGLVMEDVAQLVGVNDHFPFTSIDLIFDPHRPNVSARASDDYWVAAYLWHFSVNAGGGGG